MPPARRLEDRIRELSARLASAENGEFERVLAELRDAMNEHTQRFKNKISSTLLRWQGSQRERRKA